VFLVVARGALAAQLGKGREIECSSKVVGNTRLNHFLRSQSAAQDPSQPCNKCALASNAKQFAMRRKHLKWSAKLQQVNGGNAGSNYSMKPTMRHGAVSRYHYLSCRIAAY
jgi:hypothetical protein